MNIQPKTNASNYLPTFVNGVSINGEGTNATNLAAIQANSSILPQFAAAGFTNNLVTFGPYTSSNYNGLILGLQGRVHGVQTNVAYTWSKAMDNGTAEVFSTSLTPRRPQNPRDFTSEYSKSALDHTHRLTAELSYQFQPFSPDKNLLHPGSSWHSAEFKPQHTSRSSDRQFRRGCLQTYLFPRALHL